MISRSRSLAWGASGVAAKNESEEKIRDCGGSFGVVFMISSGSLRTNLCSLKRTELNYVCFLFDRITKLILILLEFLYYIIVWEKMRTDRHDFKFSSVLNSKMWSSKVILWEAKIDPFYFSVVASLWIESSDLGYRWLVHSLLSLLINFYPSFRLTMPIMNLQLLFLKPANRIPKSYNKKDALLLKFDWIR